NRDPKGLYKKVRSGEIAEFTGVNAPYEAPTQPEITLDTETLSVEASVSKIMDYLQNISISMTFKFNNKKLKVQSNGDIKYHCHNIIYYIYFSSIVRIVTCAFRSK